MPYLEPEEPRNSCCESGAQHSPWSCENQTLCHNFAWKGLTLGARADLRWTADPTLWTRSSPWGAGPLPAGRGRHGVCRAGSPTPALAAGGVQSQPSSPRLGFPLTVHAGIGKRPTCRRWCFPPSLGAEYAVGAFLNSLGFCACPRTPVSWKGPLRHNIVGGCSQSL